MTFFASSNVHILWKTNDVMTAVLGFSTLKEYMKLIQTSPFLYHQMPHFLKSIKVERKSMLRVYKYCLDHPVLFTAVKHLEIFISDEEMIPCKICVGIMLKEHRQNDSHVQSNEWISKFTNLSSLWINGLVSSYKTQKHLRTNNNIFPFLECSFLKHMDNLQDFRMNLQLPFKLLTFNDRHGILPFNVDMPLHLTRLELSESFEDRIISVLKPLVLLKHLKFTVSSDVMGMHNYRSDLLHYFDINMSPVPANEYVHEFWNAFYNTVGSRLESLIIKIPVVVSNLSRHTILEWYNAISSSFALFPAATNLSYLEIDHSLQFPVSPLFSDKFMSSLSHVPSLKEIKFSGLTNISLSSDRGLDLYHVHEFKDLRCQFLSGILSFNSAEVIQTLLNKIPKNIQIFEGIRFNNPSRLNFSLPKENNIKSLGCDYHLSWHGMLPSENLETLNILFKDIADYEMPLIMTRVKRLNIILCETLCKGVKRAKKDSAIHEDIGDFFYFTRDNNPTLELIKIFSILDSILFDEKRGCDAREVEIVITTANENSSESDFSRFTSVVSMFYLWMSSKHTNNRCKKMKVDASRLFKNFSSKRILRPCIECSQRKKTKNFIIPSNLNCYIEEYLRKVYTDGLKISGNNVGKNECFFTSFDTYRLNTAVAPHIAPSSSVTKIWKFKSLPFVTTPEVFIFDTVLPSEEEYNYNIMSIDDSENDDTTEHSLDSEMKSCNDKHNVTRVNNGKKRSRTNLYASNEYIPISVGAESCDGKALHLEGEWSVDRLEHEFASQKKSQCFLPLRYKDGVKLSSHNNNHSEFKIKSSSCMKDFNKRRIFLEREYGISMYVYFAISRKFNIGMLKPL